MHRTLNILYRRDPSRDRQVDQVQYEGYQFLWPDGRPMRVGMDAFCKHGQRMFSLGRHMEGRREQLVEMICVPIADRNAPMTRFPGRRVRRFQLQRHGPLGKVYLLDGSPTTLVFNLDSDEVAVLNWIGLPNLRDGDSQWFDLATRTLELASFAYSYPSASFENSAVSTHPIV